MTLEDVAYGIALKKAARVGGAFRQHARQVVIILKLPEGAVPHRYEAAAVVMLGEMEALHRLGVVVPRANRKGVLDTAAVEDQIQTGSSLLVLWPPGHVIPRSIVVAADHLFDVDPVRPFHLVAAAKAVLGYSVGLADATRILEHPPEVVFAALRPGRELDVVLDRLQQATTIRSSYEAIRLEDMAGYGEARDWGLSLATDIGLWKQGRISWQDVDRGILLSGPPGTGKTLFAGALASTCNAHLVAASVSRWQSAGHLGDTLAAMRASFSEAATRKPSILFLDELDSIGNRATLSGRDAIYWTQVVNSLLELVDGHERLDGVVVVGATNHPEAIDPALMRSGRLDRHIRIPLPDAEARRHFARTYFGDHLMEDELVAISVATAGFSGADFAKVGREARREARRTGAPVTADTILRNLPQTFRIEGTRRRAVSIHEAGHAIVGVHLKVGELEFAAVPWEVRGAQPVGFAHFEIKNDKERDRMSYLDQVAMLLGGRAAEEEVLETAYVGAGGGEGSDLHQATDLVTFMEIQLGMGEGISYLDAKTPADRDRIRRSNRVVAARVERVLSREMTRSREIVRKYRQAVEAVAEALETKGHVSGEEVARLLSGEAEP
ncbi:AAA family ATPase [Pseudorhizobium sp. NPDC055634]